jgi:UDPglucose 6-dehydrogenase
MKHQIGKLEEAKTLRGHERDKRRARRNMKIGIVGLGAVGGSLCKVMKAFHLDVKGYDIDPEKTINKLNDIFETDVILLALPTPLSGTGPSSRLDASLLTEYLKKLEANSYKGLVVIKSTLPVGYMKEIKKRNLRILYNPEFAHNKTAVVEMVDPPYLVCAGLEGDIDEYKRVFYWVPVERFHIADDRTTEITKLAMNAFAATKISFVNEIERICKIHGADEAKVMEILRLDKRCGSEYAYPNRGPYGGSCLPKDIAELSNSTPDSILLEAVEEVNQRVKKNATVNAKHAHRVRMSKI